MGVRPAGEQTRLAGRGCKGGQEQPQPGCRAPVATVTAAASSPSPNRAVCAAGAPPTRAPPSPPQPHRPATHLGWRLLLQRSRGLLKGKLRRGRASFSGLCLQTPARPGGAGSRWLLRSRVGFSGHGFFWASWGGSESVCEETRQRPRGPLLPLGAAGPPPPGSMGALGPRRPLAEGARTDSSGPALGPAAPWASVFMSLFFHLDFATDETTAPSYTHGDRGAAALPPARGRRGTQRARREALSAVQPGHCSPPRRPPRARFRDPAAQAGVPRIAPRGRQRRPEASRESLVGCGREASQASRTKSRVPPECPAHSHTGVVMDAPQWGVFPLFALAPRKLRVGCGLLLTLRHPRVGF